MPILHDLRLQVIVNETVEVDEEFPKIGKRTVIRHIIRTYYNGTINEEYFADPVTILQAAEKVLTNWRNAMMMLVKAQKEQEKEKAPKIIMPGGNA